MKIIFCWRKNVVFFFFAVLKYAIKSETVVRLTSGHDANRVLRLEARRYVACRRTARAITHGATWLTQNPSFVRRRGRRKCEEATSPSFGSTGRVDSCVGVTHATRCWHTLLRHSSVVSFSIVCVPRCLAAAKPMMRSWESIMGLKVSWRILLCEAWYHEFFNTLHIRRWKSPEAKFLET